MRINLNFSTCLNSPAEKDIALRLVHPELVPASSHTAFECLLEMRVGGSQSERGHPHLKVLSNHPSLQSTAPHQATLMMREIHRIPCMRPQRLKPLRLNFVHTCGFSTLILLPAGEIPNGWTQVLPNLSAVNSGCAHMRFRPCPY